MKGIVSCETWHLQWSEEICQTLKRRDYKDPQIVLMEEDKDDPIGVTGDHAHASISEGGVFGTVTSRVGLGYVCVREE